jgi:hypothetical protein
MANLLIRMALLGGWDWRGTTVEAANPFQPRPEGAGLDALGRFGPLDEVAAGNPAREHALVIPGWREYNAAARKVKPTRPVGNAPLFRPGRGVSPRRVLTGSVWLVSSFHGPVRVKEECLMHDNAMAPETGAALRDALLAGCVNVTEDGTLCFVSDRLYRTCPACGTVFTGSAWKAALFAGQACPFCGRIGTRPLVRAGVACS